MAQSPRQISDTNRKSDLNYRLFENDEKLLLRGGIIRSSVDYRSLIDTPFIENDVLIYNVTGNIEFTVASIIPLTSTFTIRQSNSSFFRDIFDFQLTYDSREFSRTSAEFLKKRMQNLYASAVDTLSEKVLKYKESELEKVNKWLSNPFQLQRLVEAYEIINVKGISYNPSLSIKANAALEDSIRLQAQNYLSLYKMYKEKSENYFNEVDSLKKVVATVNSKKKKFDELLDQDWRDYSSLKKLSREYLGYGISDITFLKKYRWISGLKKFNLGRGNLNHSELTAKNITLNGFNLEFNSWYYFAVAGGAIDFRFRDYAVGKRHDPQHLYLIRAGLGSKESNHIIFTGLKGKKQLFASTSDSARQSTIDIKGLSVEAMVRFLKYNFLSVEVAESFSPDFRSSSLDQQTRHTWSSNNNKAILIKLNSYLPLTNSRLQAFYKYTGSNYQSYSSFQTNSSFKSWHVRGEQYVWKKKIKIGASIRTSDFTNPYIIQSYKSNTILKNFSASFRSRKLPSFSIGYIPLSQLTVLDEQVIENNFHSLNANFYYLFRLSKLRTATTFVYNKFFNNKSDSSFTYYNAENIYYGQSLFFNSLTANISIGNTRNNEFNHYVFDESIQFNILSRGNLTLGVKINNYNNAQIKVGGYSSIGIPIGKLDMIHASYERGFLPGNKTELVRNDMASIQFIKVFRPFKIL